MRFLKYTNTIKKWKCTDFLQFFTTNSLSWDRLSYINKSNFVNIHYGLIHTGAPTLINCDKYQLPYIQSEIKNFTLCKNGDIIFTDASEDTKDICKTVELIKTSNFNVVSGLHTIHARDIKNLTVLGFKGYLFSSYNFHKQVYRLTQGTKIFSININNFKDLYVGIPSAEEQKDIVSLLSKIDARIDTQNKIIEDLKSLKKFISFHMFFDINNKIKLSELCTITTGKLDANQMDINGIYPFFTCGKETLKINKYAFDCEAILISGNGDIGHTKYYNGKFNAYQRTYVLYNFKSSPKFIKYAIDHVLPKKIKEETQSSAMPYIKLATLSNLNIPFPEIEIQNQIVKILELFQRKIDLEQSILNKLKEQKKYLLSNMFI